MTGLLVALLLAAGVARPFADERLLLDRRLAALRRALPDGPTPAVDVSHVRELAASAGLIDTGVAARAPLESNGLGTIVIDLSGTARFAEIDRFFRQLALSPRLVDVESLSLASAPEDLVHLRATLRLPFRPAGQPLPAPPRDARDGLGGVPRPQADLFVRDQALALAKSEAIARLRRGQRNPRLLLAEIAAIARDHPVAFTEVVAGERFQARGLILGEGPSRDLEARFERGFFRMSSFLMARQGACRRFEASGVAPVVGLAAELPLPAEDPFRQDEAPCRIDRDAKRGPEIARRNGARRNESGPISLRLRDVDLADVFFALHLVTAESFVVDGDVEGRVSLEMTRLTLDEVLQALGSAGLRISGGPVRRVALGRGPVRAVASHAASGPDGETPRSTFAVKHGDVRELLALMTEADPGLASLGPGGSLGRASVWAANAPLGELRAVLLDSAGLVETLEDGRRLLRRAGSNEEPVAPVAGTPSQRRLAFGPGDVESHELELAGLASGGSGWVAFAYAPTGVLLSYRVGSPIFDGTVRSVESTDVTLDTIEGPLRVLLPGIR